LSPLGNGALVNQGALIGADQMGKVPSHELLRPRPQQDMAPVSAAVAESGVGFPKHCSGGWRAAQRRPAAGQGVRSESASWCVDAARRLVAGHLVLGSRSLGDRDAASRPVNERVVERGGMVRAR